MMKLTIKLTLKTIVVITIYNTLREQFSYSYSYLHYNNYIDIKLRFSSHNTHMSNHN